MNSYRDEDDSSDSFCDPAVKIPEDVQFLHGLPVSKSGLFLLKLSFLIVKIKS
jgi:hypothetical protein